jgi:hypothetical protein
MDQVFHIVRCVTHVTILAASLLRSIQQRPNTTGAIGSKCLAKELADGAALGLCHRRYLFGEVGRQRNRELSSGALHNITLLSNA